VGGRVEDAFSRVDAEAVRGLPRPGSGNSPAGSGTARGRLLSIARDNRRAGSDHDERRGDDRARHPPAGGLLIAHAGTPPQ
jgi:hypothetical protein